MLIDAEVAPDGRSAHVVFATERQADGTEIPQGDSKALIWVFLATGAITVVDGKLADKHIGEIAFDASRRNLLVFTGQHSDNLKGQWGSAAT